MGSDSSTQTNSENSGTGNQNGTNTNSGVIGSGNTVTTGNPPRSNNRRMSYPDNTLSSLDLKCS